MCKTTQSLYPRPNTIKRIPQAHNKRQLCCLGYYYILSFQLLRARIKQRGISEVGRSTAGHALCPVHRRVQQNETAHIQAEDRPGRVVGNQGTPRTRRDQQDEAGTGVPQGRSGDDR